MVVETLAIEESANAITLAEEITLLIVIGLAQEVTNNTSAGSLGSYITNFVASQATPATFFLIV